MPPSCVWKGKEGHGHGTEAVELEAGTASEVDPPSPPRRRERAGLLYRPCPHEYGPPAPFSHSAEDEVQGKGQLRMGGDATPCPDECGRSPAPEVNVDQPFRVRCRRFRGAYGGTEEKAAPAPSAVWGWLWGGVLWQRALRRDLRYRSNPPK